MTRPPSLARAVVLRLVVAQLCAFVFGGIFTMGAEVAHIAFFRLTVDEIAAPGTCNLVIASLVRGPDGSVRIEPNAKLRAEMRRTPLLKYAAFDEARRPIAGSSPELSSTLERTGVIQISQAHLHFNFPGDPETTPLGYMERRRTPFGWMHIATYRQKFHWTDVFTYLHDILEYLSLYILSVVSFSIGATFYAVRRGFAPLRAVGAQVERIDLDSLGDGVSARDAPIEIRPFIDKINAALARLAANAARMRRYTANAAHELRTPLAILRARLEDSEEPTFKVDLKRDASQLQAIVEQMLIAARLTERQASLDQKVDLADAIRQVVTDYSPLVLDCDRRIEFETATPPIFVRGNRRAIESVVANLIDNALRAEPLGGTVLVRVSADAVVEVVDHGEGVALSDREMIFEPFWRKSEATPGTGLGLAIAKELIEKLGGRIWVEDTPHGGATFKLSLERVDELKAGRLSRFPA
jgi:signal transduction histidine kinase